MNSRRREACLASRERSRPSALVFHFLKRESLVTKGESERDKNVPATLAFIKHVHVRDGHGIIYRATSGTPFEDTRRVGLKGLKAA